MNELPDLESRGFYLQQQELDWQDTTQVAPGYFGIPGHSLYDLGEQIASDQRYTLCAVRRVYEALLGRVIGSDRTVLLPHHQAFVESGLNMKTLARSILNDAGYRAQIISNDSSDSDSNSDSNSDDSPLILKLLTPSLLSSKDTSVSAIRFVFLSITLVSPV